MDKKFKVTVDEAIQHRGLSFIEVLIQCPIQQRRIFNLRRPIQTLPPRILQMFQDCTYVKDRPERESYLYAIPRESPEAALEAGNTYF